MDGSAFHGSNLRLAVWHASPSTLAGRAFYGQVTNQRCEDDFRGLVSELTGTLFEII